MSKYETSKRNLSKARARGLQPRPWRCLQVSQMVRRYVFQWFTCRGTRPSVRTWAQDLGIIQTWHQKLVREFRADPSKMYREQRISGDPKFAQLTLARGRTRRMRGHGELRPSKDTRLIQ